MPVSTENASTVRQAGSKPFARAIAAVVLALSLSSGAFAQEAAGHLEIGEAAGEPGEVVEVPLLYSSPHPLCAFIVLFKPRFPGLEFLGYDVEGSAVESADPSAVVSEALFEGGMFGVVWCSFPDGPIAPPGDALSLGRLRFRVSAGTPLGDVELRAVSRLFDTNAFTHFSAEIDGSVESIEVTIASGRVTVLPPSGPLPVEDLVCEQFLDRVELAFRAFLPYDAIEVHRDGELIATLPSDARRFSEALPRLGPLSYSVTAWQDGKRSVPVDCVLVAVTPAAPPPEDLRCQEGTLTWRNPRVYDAIRILRNGGEIAELPGDARRFSDESKPEGPTIYSVVGELEGYSSPEATCIADGIWGLEAGDVRVPLGAERVVVPIFATTPEPARGLQVLLGVDLDRFELIRDREAALAGTVGPTPEFLGIGFNPHTGDPFMGIQFEGFPPPGNDLQPGLRQHVINLVLRPKRDSADGESFPVAAPICEIWCAKKSSPVKPLHGLDGRIDLVS